MTFSFMQNLYHTGAMSNISNITISGDKGDRISTPTPAETLEIGQYYLEGSPESPQNLSLQSALLLIKGT